jgi:hypothetical protein
MCSTSPVGTSPNSISANTRRTRDDLIVSVRQPSRKRACVCFALGCRAVATPMGNKNHLKVKKTERRRPSRLRSRKFATYRIFSLHISDDLVRLYVQENAGRVIHPSSLTSHALPAKTKEKRSSPAQPIEDAPHAQISAVEKVP